MHPAVSPIIRPRGFSVSIIDFDETTFNGIDGGDAVTFEDMAAGSARPDRLLIAGLTWRDGIDDVTLSESVLIGGVTATEVVRSLVAVGGGPTTFAGIFSAVVPAGTEVDVAPTVTGFSGTIDSWGLTLVRATGLKSNVALATAVENAAVPPADGILTLNTAGARFAMVVAAELGGDLSARTPTSSSGSSTLLLGHRMTRGLAYIDTTPSGANTDYTINAHGAQNPDLIVAACWG
jgi:hypothetical protein